MGRARTGSGRRGFMPPLLPRSLWQAITVHDLTHLQLLRAPFIARSYGSVLKPLMRRMDTVFTVSEFSRREIIDWSGLQEDRVVAVAHGLDAAFVAQGPAFQLGRPYILYVGNRRGYKNIRRLMEAFARSTLTYRGLLLALSGRR